jgi:hypothetical protein
MRWVALIVVCGSVGGCTSADYDAAYEQRVADHARAAEFVALRPDGVAVAEGRAELRLPAILTDQLDGSETPRRSTPPFIAEFPGFTAAYEGQVDATDGRFPVVLTVGLVPAAERQKAAEAILRQVRQDEEFKQAVWSKGRELADESAAIRKWDVLDLKGSQPFQVTKADITAEKRLPGTTAVWLAADPGQKACVILAWRVPDDALGKLPLPEMAELTARTVRMLPQP